MNSVLFIAAIQFSQAIHYLGEIDGAGELSVFCQSYFNKTLIGQAGSIGGKARQEVEVEQRDWEYSGKQEAPFATPAQATREERCELPH